jgi:heat shock protein HslJ
MSRPLSVLTSLMLIAAAAACAPKQDTGSIQTPPPPSPAASQSWFIASALGTEILPGSTRERPSLNISNGAISGHAGCNRFNGQIANPPAAGFASPVSRDAPAPWLAGGVVTTRMACEPAAMAVEAKVTEALRRAYGLREGLAVAELLDQAGQPVMRLVPAGAPPAGSSLEGRVWQLVSIGGQPVTIAPKPTLEISSNRLAGNGGCNQFGGSVTVTGGALRTVAGAMTMMACLDNNRNQLEMTYTQALWAATAYEQSGNRLVITGTGARLEFEAR